MRIAVSYLSVVEGSIVLLYLFRSVNTHVSYAELGVQVKKCPHNRHTGLNLCHYSKYIVSTSELQR